MRQSVIKCLAVVALVGAVVLAQEQLFEYGKKSELHGVTAIFLDTGTELRFRENAVALLAKELPEVRVADRVEDAQVVLAVGLAGSDRGHGSARIVVWRPGSVPGAKRLLAEYADQKSSIFTSKLSTVLMHRFIRDYREANRTAN